MTNELKDLSIELFNAEVFKLGEFYTKSGFILSAYFDLQAVLGYPSLMNKICDCASKFCTEENLNFHSICGVSYGGLPFGIILASKLEKPLLIRNKEISFQPSQTRIEGEVIENQYCIVVEEVIASGNSVLEVIKDIETVGMKVQDIYTIIDLEQGGSENFAKMGYKMHSLIKMSQLVKFLYEDNLITIDRHDEIMKGWADKFAPNGDCITNTNLGKRKSTRYETRMDSCKSKIGKKLFKFMLEKKSNICVNFVDQNVDTILNVAELIGPYICILSISLDCFKISEKSKIQKLLSIAKDYNFLLMDDSKLSDDGDVIVEQCRQRFQFVDLLTILPISGENILRSVKSVVNEFSEKGVFVIAFPNISDTLIGSSYERDSIKMTIELFEEAVGFVSNRNSEIPLDYIHMRSDLKISASTSKQSNNMFYNSEIISSDICADVILLHFEKFENIEKIVRKEQLLLWNAYARR